MGAALLTLPDQWLEVFGYQPLLAESFTDPEAYAYTTYKATNWQLLSTTQGYARSRLDFYVPNESPKRLWCLELRPKARSKSAAVITKEFGLNESPKYSATAISVNTSLRGLSPAHFELKNN